MQPPKDQKWAVASWSSKMAKEALRERAAYVLDSICIWMHNRKMEWSIGFHDDFEPEFDNLDEEVQNEILALMGVLKVFGPGLGRPRVDTLKGSRHANMKELRFDAADGVWRVAFAFDPKRRAVLLVAGDKSGGSEKRFYKQLIRKADARFGEHLGRLEKERKDKQ